ncbi:hypothetical protein Scep_021785 [Stephania cephalantha]|uniref:Uncharacterized protein n=1 Tax=Stephania cephalantha TaxID=152367 RepID=A0AAP0I1N6_9MAGN
MNMDMRVWLGRRHCRCIPLFIDRLDRLQRRRQELTQATPDQSVDDEAVYLNVAGECPKGRVYGLGSLGRKKRRYADPGASTSQMPDMVPRAEFNVVAEQLRKVMEFMHQHLGMNMDEAGLSQQQPPPPPPHDQQLPPQIDPVDPPQQGDNVERETQEWLTRDEQLDVTFAWRGDVCEGVAESSVFKLWTGNFPWKHSSCHGMLAHVHAGFPESSGKWPREG